MQKLLMGNEAIALAALHAGAGFISGYPGTPSSEIIDTCAKIKDDDVYVEWSVNEKAAVEVAAGAAYAGQRALVAMKQVGLNAACDAVMNLNYVGVKGALVLVICDDPGPISSQTEQDTRRFAAYARIPVFDPESPEDAYQMTLDAFELSERLASPVILRPTTRVCHACAVVDVRDVGAEKARGIFVKDSKWIIFPAASHRRKIHLFEREPGLAAAFSAYPKNELFGEGTLGIAASGVSAAYLRDVLGDADARVLKVATPYPFPEALALKFLSGLQKVLVIEELDPVVEDALLYTAGKHHLNVEIFGKHTGNIRSAGENTAQEIARVLRAFLYGDTQKAPPPPKTPPLPMRPPVLCAGCPHRASFYAVKCGARDMRAVFSGDIGCYTLGNAAPLHMVDTCLCMGAGITIPQGLERAEGAGVHFGFVGDSTFFHSGITGIINAVFNNANLVVVVLDNGTTAMTGNQPHPGTGINLMGDAAPKLSIPEILKSIGVSQVEVVDPKDFVSAVQAVRRATRGSGVRAIVFESPCVAQMRGRSPSCVIKDKCVGCESCIREIGCPAISMDGAARIDEKLCKACGLCAHVCPIKAIERGDEGV